MLESFLQLQNPDLAHPLFGSIVGLLKFFLFLIESFEVIVFCDHGLRGTIELPSDVRDRLFPELPLREQPFFRSPVPPPVSSRLFSSCVSFCHFFDSAPFSPTCRG